MNKFDFYDALLDVEDKNYFEKSVLQLNEKLNSIPKFKSKDDLEFKKFTPI